MSLTVPTGGAAVCARVEEHSAAIPFCEKRAGVHAGPQRHHQGAHGPAAAPAHKEWHPPT